MGAGTFSQIYIQMVFAVSHRNALINPIWEEELYKYITGIVQNKGQKLIAINGMPDHIHIFFGMKPTCCISDLVREVKKASTNWVNQSGKSAFKFQWQEGYGVFSYGHSAIGNVARYIENQKAHHQKVTFQKEYLSFLEKFEVEYDSQYLFEFFD